jgi:2-dehydropantoate 2-reductase
MKVAIIGPGAMGCLFAAKFCEAGIKTTLMDYRTDRTKRMSKNGITVETDSGEITAKPTFTTAMPAKSDLIIVLTKSYSSSQLKIPAGIPVLTLQNGLGNVEILCELSGSANVIAGSTSEAATLLDEGRVKHAASGKTVIGSWTSCSTDLAEECLKKAGFDVEVTFSPGQTIWEKTVINAGINPITAILDISNSKILQTKHARQLMRDLVVEAAKVASTEGYRYDYSLVEKAEEMCEKTGENISSMLQDVRLGKSTEIDAISGEILRRAELASLNIPRTRVVWQIVKSLEQR